MFVWFICLFSTNMVSFCTFSVLLTVLIVFLALVTLLSLCIINHLHFPCSQASRQSILMFATLHWLPNSLTAPVTAAQPEEPIVPLCFWSELCGADCQRAVRHFSASMAANLQIAPCSPKLMEGQFVGSKGLNRSAPCAPIILWVWIYFLTFAACYPPSTSTFTASTHTYLASVCCTPHVTIQKDHEKPLKHRPLTRTA